MCWLDTKEAIFFTISLHLGFVELANLSNIACLPVNCIYILVLVY